MMGRVLDRQPGLVFDLMEEFPDVRLGLRGAPQPQQEQVPAPDWLQYLFLVSFIERVWTCHQIW